MGNKISALNGFDKIVLAGLIEHVKDKKRSQPEYLRRIFLIPHFLLELSKHEKELAAEVGTHLKLWQKQLNSNSTTLPNIWLNVYSKMADTSISRQALEIIQETIVFYLFGNTFFERTLGESTKEKASKIFKKFQLNKLERLFEKENGL